MPQLQIHSLKSTPILFSFPWHQSVSSITQSCPTLCNPMGCSTPGSCVHHHLLELAQTHVHWGSDAIQPPHPLSPALLLLSIFPNIRVFSNESVLRIRWPKYWSFTFNISPSNKYSGLISFRIDWFDLLTVQGTLNSLLQTTVWKHQFFGTQPSLRSNSHPYMTTGKTIALTRRLLLAKWYLCFLIHYLGFS